MRGWLEPTRKEVGATHNGKAHWWINGLVR